MEVDNSVVVRAMRGEEAVKGAGSGTAATDGDWAALHGSRTGAALTGDTTMACSTVTSALASFGSIVCWPVAAVVAAVMFGATLTLLTVVDVVLVCWVLVRFSVAGMLVAAIAGIDDRRDERRTSAVGGLAAVVSSIVCLLTNDDCAAPMFSLSADCFDRSEVVLAALVAVGRERLAAVDLGGRTAATAVDLRVTPAVDLAAERGGGPASGCCMAALARRVARRVERRSVGVESVDCSAATSIASTSTEESGVKSTDGDVNG